MNKYLISILVAVSLLIISAKQPNFSTVKNLAQQKWVDSVYTHMTLSEKIGQLFSVGAYSDKGLAHDNRIKQLVMRYKIGGVTFLGGHPTHQATLTNQLQRLSEIPLLISMDAEEVYGTKLDSTLRYPYPMMLGAVQNDTIIQQIGTQIGEHYKQLGVHVSFMPLSTIYTDTDNRHVGNRSFGANMSNVQRKAYALLQGVQHTGTIVALKNFPTVGKVSMETTDKFPVSDLTAIEWDSIQLPSLKQLLATQAIQAVQTTHVQIPDIQTEDGLSASLSHAIVTRKLQQELGFQGLIFSDRLDIESSNQTAQIGDTELAAFLAGNDVLLLPTHVPVVIEKFEQAIADGRITEARLEQSVKKILGVKYLVNSQKTKTTVKDPRASQSRAIKAQLAHREAIKQAITAIKVNEEHLPIKNLELQKIAYVAMGDADGSVFEQTLRHYASVTFIQEKDLDQLIAKLAPYTTVIIGFHQSEASPTADYKFTDREIVWLQEIARTNNVILDVFAHPASLQKVKSFTNIDTILVSYENSPAAQEISAQIIFGALPAKGKLPIHIKEDFVAGTGISTQTLPRLGYDLPETVGINSIKLQKIDSLAQLVVSEEMAPGVQLLVARRGKIIYTKNFGYHTYDKKHKVTDNDIYDVASMTKILATLPIVMKLEESKKISLTSELAQLSEKFKNTNKDTLNIKEILSHYARLKPWIPFYINTLDSVTKKPAKEWYSKKKSKKYAIQVADRLYMNVAYKDSIMQRIIDSDLLEKHQYRYSDLPFYILKDYIESTYNLDLNTLTQQYFYQSIGAHSTTYNPLEKFSKKMIVPSEKDDYYRNQTLQGYVHDMGAAMQGGIGGHAGLFSNANDVAKMMQMYLQGGRYGDKQYLLAETIEKFNNCYFCEQDNRRGVGFDKPQLGDAGPTCGCLSMNSFGHSGFTGTYTWADPDEEIVYVFLSNRTFPTMTNRKLIKTNIRTQIQQLIYEAIED
ncbi:glycoside hydrolase family 3 N-terminal domain-containing protein [Kordia zhangzhouensis]|uniref:glycoside hydrolase family 3 N-terminal domain-containing protein n=1 Tax=Kordia zhangzhouensis TaxID=1620405 RepID=UPI0006290F60|nr:glycoside hydrolase family 3 N-terminal domain-containing protein [Kordia zhangzhouensis]